MKSYFPILLSKKGEIVALQYLAQKVKDRISPVIEVLEDVIEKIVAEDKIEKIVYKDEFEKFLKTHWSFFNNQVILDFSLLDVVPRVERIKSLLETLIKSGVNVIPTIQENSPAVFKEMVRDLIKEHRMRCCIRTSEKSGGFDYYRESIEKIMGEINITTNSTILLIDLGYAQKDNINMMGTIAKLSINSLPQKINEWYGVVVASSSFPEHLGDIQPPNQAHNIDRYEWTVWNNLQKDKNLVNLKYGDFGTKYPFYQDVNYAASVSIKYTTKDHFVIYKGKLTKEHPDGHGQYINHAKQLVQSQDYPGRNFSWGDMKIFEISQEDVKDDKRKTGSSTTWVQISQNHHITLLDSLL